MTTNTNDTTRSTDTHTIVADFARIDSELDAIHFHAKRLHDLTDVILAADPVDEPRVEAAFKLATAALAAVNALPSYSDAPWVGEQF